MEKNKDNNSRGLGDLGGLGNILGGITNMFGSSKGNNPLSSIFKMFGMNKRGANSGKNRCTVRVLAIEDAYRKIKSGSICVLDVRTEMEHKTIRIKGSVNIPLDRLQYEIVNKIPNKQDNIIIYCATGSRVRRALQILWSMGYTNLCIWEGAGLNTFAFQDVIVYNNDNRNVEKGDTKNDESKQPEL